jgi:hypothetical protein
MARLFWQGLSMGKFPDGRLALSVLFRQQGTGDTHEWTPKWVELAELTQTSYAVEVANQTDSPYAALLEDARSTESERQKHLVKRSAPEVEPLRQVWCFQCDWHVSPSRLLWRRTRCC